MVLLQNDSVKWTCRGFVPARGTKAPHVPGFQLGFASRVALGKLCPAPAPAPQIPSL